MLTAIQDTPYRREATVILQILLWCDEHLTLKKCNDAIIVRPERQPGFSANDRFFDARDIINVCSGLVTITRSPFDKHEVPHLQLAHASVREYLLSEEVIQPFQAHLTEIVARSDLLRMCHTYLCCVDWYQEQQYPLARWAIYEWPTHAKYLEAINDDKLASVLDILQQAAYEPEHYLAYDIVSSDWFDMTQSYLLYLAVVLGLRRSCVHLMQLEVDACSSKSQLPEKVSAVWADENGDCVYGDLELTRTPSQQRLDASLLAASSIGHYEIVQDLLSSGAHPDALLSEGNHGTRAAWHLASMMGHMKVVWLLINSGAVVPNHKRDALCKALESEDTIVVKNITDEAMKALRRLFKSAPKGRWRRTENGTQLTYVRF